MLGREFFKKFVKDSRKLKPVIKKECFHAAIMFKIYHDNF